MRILLMAVVRPESGVSHDVQEGPLGSRRRWFRKHNLFFLNVFAVPLGGLVEDLLGLVHARTSY